VRLIARGARLLDEIDDLLKKGGVLADDMIDAYSWPPLFFLQSNMA
jgi:hypothetical protein